MSKRRYKRCGKSFIPAHVTQLKIEKTRWRAERRAAKRNHGRQPSKGTVAA